MEAGTLRVYLDTSVFGGCFDEEFNSSSNRIIELVRKGSFRLVISDITLLELSNAPSRVQNLLVDLPAGSVERVVLNSEVEALRDAYLQSGIVSPSSDRDAAHTATVANADLIVSWNFKHIVHFDKIMGYHEVNRNLGYREIPIHSPAGGDLKWSKSKNLIAFG